MNLEQAENKMKKKCKVYQVIGLTDNSQNKSFVFATERDAKNFLEEQNFLVAHQILSIDFHSFKK